MKSAIAREQFRRQATARGVSAEAQSRGISPEDHISPALSAALEADGLNVRAEPVRALVVSDLAEADIIVAFDALPGSFGVWPIRDWSSLPSMNANYREASDVLAGWIGGLLDEIAVAPTSA